MLVLGLAGPAQVGKNAISSYLVQRYGFMPCAFSGALYYEVQCAFNLETEDLLRDPATKEDVTDRLSLQNCKDAEFVKVATTCMDQQADKRGSDKYLLPSHVPLSPRQVLQWWGTDYRRAQDPDYWVKCLLNWIGQVHLHARYPEHRPMFFVVDGVRFPNERELIHKLKGNVWHIWRDNGPAKPTGHVSEAPLPVLENERQFWNNGSLEDLQRGIDMMLTTTHKFIRVEPATVAAPPHECDFVLPIMVDGVVLGHRCPTCNRDTLTDEPEVRSEPN